MAVRVGRGQEGAHAVIGPGPNPAQSVGGADAAVEVVVGVGRRVAVGVGVAEQVANGIVGEGLDAPQGIGLLDEAVEAVVGIVRRVTVGVGLGGAVARRVVGVMDRRAVADRQQVAGGIVSELRGQARRIRLGGQPVVGVISPPADPARGVGLLHAVAG